MCFHISDYIKSSVPSFFPSLLFFSLLSSLSSSVSSVSVKVHDIKDQCPVGQSLQGLVNGKRSITGFVEGTRELWGPLRLEPGIHSLSHFLSFLLPELWVPLQMRVLHTACSGIVGSFQGLILTVLQLEEKGTFFFEDLFEKIPGQIEISLAWVSCLTLFQSLGKGK